MGASRRRIVWSPAALQQLEEALESLAARSTRAAARLLEETLSAADSLETMTERGREVPEIRDGRTRELFVRRHRLMYEVWDEHVHIVAFVYGARDFERWRHGD